MNGITHAAGGAIAGCVLASITGTGEPLEWAVVAAVTGALIPDIDQPRARIQKYLPVAGAVLGRTLRHRGLTHSLSFMAGMYFLLAVLLPVPEIYVQAFVAGILSHLILDTLNPMGVSWLWPLPGRWSIPVVHSSGIMEKLLVMPGMIVLACYALWKSIA